MVNNPGAYRYGFNGQERETEINNTGAYSAEYWFYDGRLGRRWNVDPVLYPWHGGYTCFNSNPIMFADPDGDKGTIYIYTLDQNGNKKLLTSKVDKRSYKLVKGSYYKQINLPLFKPHLELITYTKAYDYVQEVIIDAYGNYTFGEKKSVGVYKSYVEGDLFANMRATNLALEKDGIRDFLPSTKESNPTRNANDFEAFLLANIDQKELENLINAFSSDLNRYQDNVAVSPEQYEKVLGCKNRTVIKSKNL